MSNPYSPSDAQRLPSQHNAPPLHRLAWIIVILLWPVALLNYLDRQMMATMKPSMVAEIRGSTGEPLTMAQWGLALASFKWVYAALSPLAGFIGDRFSRRTVIGASLLTWSAATWATGYVVTFEQLLAARALMGVAEAFYIPTALALITDYHIGPTRSFAVGIHQTAIYCGQILGGFAGFAADSPLIGWRGAFAFCGIVGIVYAIPLFFQLPGGTASSKSDKTSDAPSERLSSLFVNPGFILLVLYFTLPALAGWVIRDWGPDILKERFSLTQGMAGVSAVVYVQIASFLGAAVGGWLADRLMRTTLRGRIYVSAFGMTLFLPALCGIGIAPSLVVAIGFFILFGLGWGCFDCNNMPILCQVVRPRLRATAFGIMNFVSISCGGVADWGFGLLRQRGVPVSTLFFTFAVIAMVSVGIVLLIRPQPSLDDNAPALH